ncbi:Uncharacterized protein PCOAH_00047030 [Plasmodium coatneyi]|uniref:Uncharacterized protein n=1 Tax=Plasmodium coatneyi TaxID=208452 RepID=A0A1B1E3I9_9APIC|nr:Uncharacterized protein PCOAH_00047030 [Plasmodium coatneyi]ANQ09572.1 Uncharacterized protein PCOAH_00047030 [Plasmodium coatneyi]
MDITEFEIPLFSPNITEINFGIFDLWLRGHNEFEVLCMLQNNFYADLIKRKNELNNAGDGDADGDGDNVEGKAANKEKGDHVISKEIENAVKEKYKDNVFFVKNRIMNMFNTENKESDYIGSNILFDHFLCLYIKQQFYIFHILSHHLTNLDLRFSNFYIPISKNKALKLIKNYYNIDFNLEKEIIKYKSINNISKYTNEFVKITNIHKISVKRQIENIKNMWKYIINIYERRNIDISTLYKKRRISMKNVLKFLKKNFRLYKFFMKKETVLDMNNNDGHRNKSFLFKKKKKKRKGKGKKKAQNNTNSKNEYLQYNIIKTLENLVGIYLAKRYFRLYWIISYHIEVPKKVNIPYPYFNNIILLLLEKLQINDLILSKEYINISKGIYSTFKSSKNMDALKSKLCGFADINNSLRTRILIRLKCIMNLLCCFRNSYEITKFLLIFHELQKNEPFTNEKTFIKQNIGSNNFVNRIMCFIKEAENYSKRKKAEFEILRGNEKTNIS